MTAFLECPICFGLLRNAVETDCGHCFCADCLSKTRKHDNSCPTCRKAVQFVHPSFIVRDLVLKYGGSDGRAKLDVDAAAQRERDADVDEHEDPLIIAMQFKKWADCCCGGGSGSFDPEDVFSRESLEEFMAADGFHDTLDKVNKAIRTWTPGCCSTALAYCLWPCCCCCMLFVCSEYAVWKVEVALKDANEAAARAQAGHVWALMHMDGEDREAGLIDHRFFLVLTIDPVKARKYMKGRGKPPGETTGQAPGSAEEIEAARRLAAEKDAEIQRLRRENELINSKLLERGLKLVRTMSGRVVSPVFRTATRPSTPARVRSPFSAQSSPFSGGSSGREAESYAASPLGGSPRGSPRLPNVDETAVLPDDVAAQTTVGAAASLGLDPAAAPDASASESGSGPASDSASALASAGHPIFSSSLDLPQISLPRVRVLRAGSTRRATVSGALTSPRADLSPTAQAAEAAKRRDRVMQEPAAQQMPLREEAAATRSAESLPQPGAAAPDDVAVALALAGRANVNGEIKYLKTGDTEAP